MIDPNVAIARAQRWKLFYEEDGGLKDIIQDIATAYIERMALVEPWETDKLSKLAIANRVTLEIGKCVQAIIAEGQVAEHARDNVRRIEQIPVARRRWADALGMG